MDIAQIRNNRMYAGQATPSAARPSLPRRLPGQRLASVCGLILVVSASICQAGPPVPLLAPNHPANWWFVFKFNAAAFPGCDGDHVRQCAFGGTVQSYKFGQQFVYASSENSTLQKGSGCAGANVDDPLGSTVDQIYKGAFHYVVWNDQFYDDPIIKGCTKSCGKPWAHSKGMVAWDDSGDGVVLQVTTPSWPAAASQSHPRSSDGNTLGCVTDDNVLVSQHFFALKLNKDDLIVVLDSLRKISAVTDTTNPQIVANGGPPEVQALVRLLGKRATGTDVTVTTLSTGVELIAKPSALHVPPWQMVSALLGEAALRTATWWAPPRIPSTTADTQIACWSTSLKSAAAVEVATTGHWDGTTFGLTGGLGPNFNHAKIGVSTTEGESYVVFGDMNEQGALSGTCDSSQNGRGGLFFVLKDQGLSKSVGQLIQGQTAPSTQNR